MSNFHYDAKFFQETGFWNDLAQSPSLSTENLRAYIHVPFCSVRCGYCDFNTYTAAELSPGLNPASWERALCQEISAAGKRLHWKRPLKSIFFGGGTPSLVGAEVLGRILAHLIEVFGIVPDCEITTEVNPESAGGTFFPELYAAGFNRVSIGMQSSSSQVLQILDRVHSPELAIQAAHTAQEAGFRHISLDLIYGTPGESLQDWEESVLYALKAPIDHLSAYALTVEPGTALARKIRHQEIAAIDEDAMADKYLILDGLLQQAGFAWYEISNWSLPGGECRHNIGYWNRDHWWGFGPGAHSCIGSFRWWNRKHPQSYISAIEQGNFPIHDGERLDTEQLNIENIMLNLRLGTGISLDFFSSEQRKILAIYQATEAVEVREGSVILTVKGRLLADAIIRDLI